MALQRFSLKFAIATALALSAPPALALGDLMVAPTRVLFEGTKRTVAISLVNTGNEPATYRVSFLNQRMTEQGGYEEIKEAAPEEKFADSLVRFTPKQVVIPPGSAQVVRLQLHKPSGLPEGEYRSHLLFRAIPPVMSNELNPEQKALSVRLIPVYGVSIPVIVRLGQTSAKASLSDLTLVKGKNQSEVEELSVRINRSGSRSIYGDLTVDFIAKDGSRKVLQRVNGLAVYTPNATRIVRVALGQPLSPGSIQVSFKESSEATSDPASAVTADIGLELP